MENPFADLIPTAGASAPEQNPFADLIPSTNPFEDLIPKAPKAAQLTVSDEDIVSRLPRFMTRDRLLEFITAPPPDPQAVRRDVLEQERNRQLAEQQDPTLANVLTRAGLAIGQAGGELERQAGGVLTATRIGKRLGRGMLARGASRAEEYGRLGREVGAGPAGDVTQAVSSTALTSAPVIVGALFGGFPTAVGLAATQSFGGTYAEALDEYKAQGLKQDEAEKKAILPAIASGLSTGVITAAFGRTGLEGLTLKELNAAGIRSLADNMAKVVSGSLAEGAEEFTDQVAQNLIARWSYRPELTLADALQDSITAGGLGMALGGGANVTLTAAAKGAQKAQDLFAEFKEDKDFKQRSEVAAQRAATLFADPAVQGDPRFDRVRGAVEKGLGVAPKAYVPGLTPATERMVVRTLTTRGVSEDVAQQFALVIGGKPEGETAEAYATRVLAEFRKAGGLTAEDNTYSTEQNLREAAAANQFTEEQIQGTLAQRAARDVEIAENNQRLVASLRKESNVQIARANEVSAQPEATVGGGVGSQVSNTPETTGTPAPETKVAPGAGQAVALPPAEAVQPQNATPELQEKRQQLIDAAQINPADFAELETAIARVNGNWGIDATAEAIRHASHGIPAKAYLQDVAKSDDPQNSEVIARAKQILDAWPVKPQTQVLLDALENLKLDVNGTLHAFGVVPLVWNGAIDFAKAAVQAGAAVADAVEQAIQWIKERYTSEFDEPGAREGMTNALNGIRTQIMGGEHFVPGREQLTPETRAESITFAEQVFREAGLPVTMRQEIDARRNMVITWWQIDDTGTQQNAAGQRLLDRLRQEIQTQNEAGKSPEHLANLINSIRLNFERGTLDTVFERPIREQLYSVAQGEASHRGAMLGALAGHSLDLSFVSRNVDVILYRVYSDAFGGEGIESLVNRVRQLEATEGSRKAALRKARETLTAKEKEAIGTKKRRWNKIQKAVMDGKLDPGTVLRELAKEEGWPVPSETEVAKMKALAVEEERLRTLTPQEKTEAKAFGDEPAAIREKEAATLSERVALKKEMQTRWARLTKPIRFLPLRTWWEQRQNFAAAANELAAANLLTKLSFPTRQAISVLSQAMVHLPTRAIAAAALNRHARIQKGEPSAWSDLWGDIAEAGRTSMRAQMNAVKPALVKAKAALKGRAQVKNIDALLSGIAALDRIELKSKELRADGKHAQAAVLWLYSQIKWGYRIAQSLDYLAGTPAEAQELALQVNRALMEDGKNKAERAVWSDYVIGDIRREWAEAVATAHRIREANGLPTNPQVLQDAAANLVKAWQYNRVQELGLPADAFEEQAELLRNVIGWNELEARGPGGLIAATGRGAQRIAGAVGAPLPLAAFSNAIGTQVNRLLHFTPFYQLANIRLPGGTAESSPWFRTELDRQQRKVEALLGTMFGAPLLLLSALGVIVVHTRPPLDREERELWEKEGHKSNTLEIPTGDGSFIPISLHTSPFTPLAPYLAAGGAINKLMTDREKAQDRLNAEAAEKGVAPGQIRPIGFDDVLAVAASSAYGMVIGGGRTASGLAGSLSEFGEFNLTKFASSQVSPNVPGLPALQEMSRMGGVVLDSKMASFSDFMLPLPTSGARKVNLLGDPAGTPDDVQRIIQIFTGGSFPGLVDSEAAKSESAYAALFASGYRPPSISPSRGFNINGQMRPMTDDELVKYTHERGSRLREALVPLGATTDIEAVRNAYRQANAGALRAVGVTVEEPSRATSSLGGSALGGLGSTMLGRSRFSRLRRGRLSRLRRGRRPSRIRSVRLGRLGRSRSRGGIRRLSRRLRQ